MEHNVLTTFRFSDLIHDAAGSYEPAWSLLGIWEDTERKKKEKKRITPMTSVMTETT